MPNTQPIPGIPPPLLLSPCLAHPSVCASPSRPQASMAGRLNLASPATPTLVSPAAGPLASDLNRYKGATVFPSHVRRTFQRFPTDYTGELVRLLDDLSTATHSIAAYITEGSENLRYGETEIGGLDPKVASKKLYRALSHGKYHCLPSPPLPISATSNSNHHLLLPCTAPLPSTAPLAARRRWLCLHDIGQQL